MDPPSPTRCREGYIIPFSDKSIPRLKPQKLKFQQHISRIEGQDPLLEEVVIDDIDDHCGHNMRYDLEPRTSHSHSQGHVEEVVQQSY
jgi:hypothetical protein